MEIPIPLSHDLMKELWSGIIGAFLGAIVGAVVAYFGSAHLQKRAENLKRRGAIRALIIEMVFNVGDLCADKKEPRVSDSVWHSQLPSIIDEITLDEFEPILVAYWAFSHLPAYREEKAIQIRKERLDLANDFMKAIKRLSTSNILSHGDQKWAELILKTIDPIFQTNKNSLDEEATIKSRSH